VADIGEACILGVPWFKSVVLNNVDWENQIFSFKSKHNQFQYQWEGEGAKPAGSRTPMPVKLLSLQELRRHIGHPSTRVMRIQLSEINALLNPKNQSDNSVANPQSEFQKHIREKFNQVFQEPTGLPPERPEDMEINTTGEIPRKRGIGRLNNSELDVLKIQLEQMLLRGHIKTSTSPYAAAILFVKKKDGTLRMCVDYRSLNDVTIQNRCPIPNVGEMRAQLQDARYFTKLDLREGYYNLRVHKDHTYKTAFRCRFGSFEFNVVPMGLTNSPAVFSAMMNRVFSPMFNDFLIAYLDDIVIYSKTEEDHRRHVEQVFETLLEHRLFVKPSKCEVMQSSIEFCGHTVDQQGVSISTDKAAAMAIDPEIENAKDIQSFIGSCVWFAEFIPDYAAITQPLTKLLRKDSKWEWGDAQKEAVLILRHLITSAPVLRYFEADKETIVYTDASDYAIGGWIGQRHQDGVHPVVFWSRKMTAAEQNYTTHEKELLAIVAMVQKHAYHLRGIQFVANTDHQALEFLQTQPNLTRRQARWIITLQEYDIKIRYFAGKWNTVADYLTRNPSVAPVCGHCNKRMKINKVAITSKLSQRTFNQNIQEQYKADQLAKKLRGYQENPTVVDPKRQVFYKQFSQRNKLWMYQYHRLYIPEGETRIQLLKQYHDLPISGHMGHTKTMRSLGKRYYWPSMSTDIKQYVQHCDTCQRYSIPTRPLDSFLHSLPSPEDRLQSISIDFAFLPIDKSNKKDLAMIIIDRLTKLTKIIPCKRTADTKEVARLFIKHWFRYYGLPKDIVSDRDSKFTANTWATVLQQLGIEQHLTTARRQQSNGQAESTVKIVKRILGKLTELKGTNWTDKVPMAEFAINNSESIATGFTPFQLAFGFEPRAFPEEVATTQTGPKKHQLNKFIRDQIDEAKVNISLNQQLQKQSYDNRRSKGELIEISDWVLIWAEGITNPAGDKSLLKPKWIGPFQVVEVEGLNCKLDLPPNLPIHPSFHVEKLRKYWHGGAWERPTPKLGLFGEEFEIEKILEKRVMRHATRHPAIHYKCRWKGFSDYESSWILFDQVNSPWSAEELDLVRQFEDENEVEFNRSRGLNASHELLKKEIAADKEVLARGSVANMDIMQPRVETRRTHKTMKYGRGDGSKDIKELAKRD
jgi:hypothetical protein